MQGNKEREISLMDREIKKEFKTMEDTNAVAHQTMNEKLDLILQENTKMQDVFTELEKRVSAHDIWKGTLAGAMCIITFFVIPLIVYSNNVQKDALLERIEANSKFLNKL